MSDIEVPTDGESATKPRRVTVTPKPRDDKKVPKPKGGEGKKDSGERKYGKWRPVSLQGDDARANQNDSNCAGVTFGKGCVYIETSEMDRILDDNYAFKYDKDKLSAGTADCVCCVVAWGEKGQWHHAALIVDVAPDGTPIVYGKDGDNDVISEYRADEYGPDWRVYCRRNPPASVELDTLTDEYRKACKEHGRDSAEARLAAYRMCQRKNALKGI